MRCDDTNLKFEDSNAFSSYLQVSQFILYFLMIQTAPFAWWHSFYRWGWPQELSQNWGNESSHGWWL